MRSLIKPVQKFPRFSNLGQEAARLIRKEIGLLKYPILPSCFPLQLSTPRLCFWCFIVIKFSFDLAKSRHSLDMIAVVCFHLKAVNYSNGSDNFYHNLNISKYIFVLTQADHSMCSRFNMYGLLTKCEVKMAGYWPSFFLRVYGPTRCRGP